MLEENARVVQRLGTLAFPLRWLILSLATIFVMLTVANQATTTNALTLLVFTSVAYFVLNLLVAQGLGQGWTPWATLALDFVFGLGLYYATRGDSGSLVWIGLLPALSASLSLSPTGALTVVGAFILSQAVLGLAVGPGALRTLTSLLVAAVILLPITLLLSFLAKRVRVAILDDIRRRLQVEATRTQILRQHTGAIYEMSSMVSASLNYREVLEAVLDFGALGAEGGLPSQAAMVSAVLFFEDDQLHVASSRRMTTSDQRFVSPGRAGLLGNVIRTGEPAIIAAPSADPELQQFASLQACRSLMALPLRAGYETYGVVLFGHPRADFFDDDQRALMVAVVNQAIVGLQNAQLFTNLRQEKERLIEVQEEAQKKLARDLHDGPTQAVAALAMRANFVRRLVERDPKTAGEELFKMEDLARRTTKEIRHMLFTLRPLVLESQGLTVALQQLAEKMHETHGQRVSVDAEHEIDKRLELNHQGVLFYIVEEAVNNARKHAQAAHVWVRLKIQPGDVMAVEIQDDGVGFNVGAVDTNYERRGSLGLVNMRERAEMIGGTVYIDSAEGRGTRVVIYIPLVRAAATASAAEKA